MKSRDSMYLMLSIVFFAASIIVFSAKGGCAGRRAEEEMRPEEAAPVKIRVDINTDDPYELSLLPGIGEKTAVKIIEFRKAHGDFSSIEGIMGVEGIKEKKFSDIKEYIYVSEDKKD